MRTEPMGRLRSSGAPSTPRQLREEAAFEPALILFQVYRLIIASLLLGVFFADFGPRFLGQTEPELYRWAGLAYLGLVVVGSSLMMGRPAAPGVLVHFMVYTDILATGLMMYASGGVTSGLGMLMAVSVAGGSLLSGGGRIALVFAAVATLDVLVTQIYADLRLDLANPAYSHAGMLGGLMFAVALLAHSLGTRASRNAELANRRGTDLANLEELNAYIIQHATTGILVVDQHNRIRLANEAAWGLLGLPTKAGKPPSDLILPALTERMSQWKADPEVELPPFRIHPSGQLLQAAFTPIGSEGTATIVSIQDYSGLTRRAQREKLVSLGRLTASIAHEIRNPLGAVSHASQLLGESPALTAADRRLTEIIQSNSQRLNLIIENVLQLSRPNVYQPRQIRLQACVTEFASQFRQQQGLPEEQLQVFFDETDIKVNIDPGQMHQVLGILCDNALTHCAQDKPPRIQLRGGRSPETDTPFLDVNDDGPGIPEETAERIFEPFYTSRHKGTGLGLYIARELSAGNQAELTYHPRPEGGSCFRLLFRSGIDQEAGE